MNVNDMLNNFDYQIITVYGGSLAGPITHVGDTIEYLVEDFTEDYTDDAGTIKYVPCHGSPNNRVGEFFKVVDTKEYMVAYMIHNPCNPRRA